MIQVNCVTQEVVNVEWKGVGRIEDIVQPIPGYALFEVLYEIDVQHEHVERKHLCQQWIVVENPQY